MEQVEARSWWDIYCFSAEHKESVNELNVWKTSVLYEEMSKKERERGHAKGEAHPFPFIFFPFGLV